MTGLLQDFLFGMRRLRKRPGWTIAIVVVLGLGIGANTAMFSGFEAWVLRPLDFEDPDRLVAIHSAQPKAGRERLWVSAPDLGDWTAEQHSFEEWGAFRRHTFNLDDPAEPVRLFGARISESLFPLLGKQPIRGRGFTVREDMAGQPADVALISRRLWTERFGGDPGIIGKTLRLDGVVHEIVGVMEPGFHFPEWGEVWTPLGLDTRGDDRSVRRLSVVGRLKEGVSAESAAAELSAVADRLARLYPETNEGWGIQVISLHEFFVPQVIDVALSASMGAALFVLLIICANVASLLLAQATARRSETAIRAALGAGRLRLLRQSLLEGVMLALPAGLLGALVGAFAVQEMLRFVPVDPPYLFRMSFSRSAGVYTLVVALLAGLVCGTVPLFRIAGVRIYEALKSGGRQDAGASTSRFRGALVAGELALSTFLVIGALLMAKSFWAIQGVDAGFQRDSILTARLTLSGEGLDQGPQRISAAERILARIQRIPRVTDASLSSRLPASDSYDVWHIEAEGSVLQPDERVSANLHSVAGGYFRTLGIPISAGRDFTETEKRQGSRVALVSKRLGRRLFGGDPVGRRLRRARSGDEGWFTIVGVVGDIEFGSDMVSFGDLPDVQMYIPYGALPVDGLSLAVRSDLTAATLAPRLREAIRGAAQGVPLSEVLTMDDLIFRVRWVSRFFSRQLMQYAILALAIAAFGIYGLTAESVSRRTRELAIRMALGAKGGDIFRLVLQGAVVLAGTGIVGGLLMAWALTRFGASMLRQVSAQDPLVFGGVALSLLGVTIAATLFPARRAVGVDPNVALRSE